MEEIKKKNEIVKAMTDVEYYPSVSEREISIEKYTKLPLTEVSALGIAFEPLLAVFQNITHTGGEIARSGLYRVTIPEGVSGHLAKFHDGSGLTATIVNETGIVGQARLNKFAYNPEMLFIAALLMSIDKKLDSIQETQQEIIEFLEQKEKSKLRGNLNVLADVMNNYKYNWNNEKYKINKHIQVQEIKRDAEQSVIFYQEQIDKKISKQSLLHSDQDVKTKLKKVQSEFKDYQLALYLYSFSTFLEVMLLENFESAYLDSVARRIEDYSYQYREIYTKCYTHIEGYSKSSIHSHLLRGLSNMNRVAGTAMAKVPVVNRSQIDETLIETSNRLGKFSSKMTERTMGSFVNNQSSSVQPFVENIKTVNRLYNQPLELLFDQENIYFSLAEN